MDLDEHSASPSPSSYVRITVTTAATDEMVSVNHSCMIARPEATVGSTNADGIGTYDLNTHLKVYRNDCNLLFNFSKVLELLRIIIQR